MVRLLFDFPGPDGRPVRTALSDPTRIVTARTLEAVRPALRTVEEGVAAGLTAAGFLAYEAAPAFEARMRVREGNRMPLLWFGLFEGDGRDEDDSARESDEGGEGEGAEPVGGPGADLPGIGEAGPDWRIDTDPDAHAAAVEAIRGHIADGRTYQVNLTTRLRAAFAGDPLRLWSRMRRTQGPGYHAYLDLGRFVIASASPELFFEIRGREITTRPMKGTRPRGRWAAEDRELRDALASSTKDRSENLMIVDLVRNDLGRVAATGSVRVPRLLHVERYRTVWQMTSTVAATLRDDVGLSDALAALFPCGSVTGAPKISTMEVIAGLESSPREVYCGAIGLLRPDGAAMFSVPIRTAWIDRERGTAEYGTGGGVVWDSTPGAEYDELLAKARVVRTPWPAFRLLETLRLQDGAPLRAERHLARLRASAEHFGFDLRDDDVAAAIDAARRQHPDGVHRLRVLVDEGGRVEVTSSPLEPPFQTGTAAAERPGSASSTAGDGTLALHPVALTRAPVASADPFLFHKTTRRDIYDRARSDAPEAWDVVLVNERGELTELTRGNLVVELDGRLLTPPLSAGLLPGCFRAELLDAGAIAEATLRPDDLRRASRVWLISSLRGWLGLRIALP